MGFPEPRLSQEQINLIKMIEDIKDNTKTFKQFEDTVMGTDWFMQRQYRGL
jgi:hypothetical protein